ncbi:hypothetical protein GDO86_015342 [Hymenochirus boettgeri]|uniref:Uncharacterized protein n=1 Tax=Hymenochirus boettgeri TaxID=247094 RepID=A0A8T2JSJ7_9PIPI|nr:hypothetical protein GDO86_015342 [Hymenochirus boettgeri]
MQQYDHMIRGSYWLTAKIFFYLSRYGKHIIFSQLYIQGLTTIRLFYLLGRRKINVAVSQCDPWLKIMAITCEGKPYSCKQRLNT